jgi:predicted CoA-substrate-specific enzyme activase
MKSSGTVQDLPGRWVAGLDIGSTTIKAVLYDGSGYHALLTQSGWNPKKIATDLLTKLCNESGLSPLPLIIATTGYGRRCLETATISPTEISCHAAGARFLVPGCRFVVDIGGQDAKGIRLSPEGNVEDFVMNDKCAAGTGRFLSTMGAALGVHVDKLAKFATGVEPHRINSMCTVFAESEVIGLINQGVSRNAIIAGIDASVARRTASMVAGLNPQPPIVFTGGVALNRDIVTRLETELRQKVVVPDDGIYAGALGAALLAWEYRLPEEECR